MDPTHEILSVSIHEADIPLSGPFVISRGRVEVVQVAFVEVTLAGGARGYGEIAPFPALTRETRARSAAVARDLARDLGGRSALDWTELAAGLREAAPEEPAARAGLECAMVDACCRARGVPLWEWWGGADVRERETDITLPIASPEETVAQAAGWYARGFRVFKLKVGADGDLTRARGVADAHPDAALVLDANQAWSETEAAAFLRELGPLASRVRLLEQPVAREDLEAMAALRRLGRVPVAADEAVFTLADARRVIERRAADVINLKIMKSGLAETIAIADLARASGVGLMVGGMVETRLAMSFSYAIALGKGGVDHIDLDTPLFMAEDPLAGGYAYAGPRLTVWHEGGVGAIPKGSGAGAT